MCCLFSSEGFYWCLQLIHRTCLRTFATLEKKGLCCKNRGGGKVESLSPYLTVFHVQVQPVQVTSLPSAQIILRCVRWYCSYPLSYRQVAEMVNERGMDVHHKSSVSLGTRVWARIGQALPTSLASYKWFMASWWDIYKSQRQGQIFISSRRFGGQHSGLSAHSQAWCALPRNVFSAKRWMRFTPKNLVWLMSIRMPLIRKL